MIIIVIAECNNLKSGEFQMADVPGILRRNIIQPKYILAIVVVLMIMMISMGLYEISASKRDIMSVLQEQAMSLAEAISIMSDNSLVCFYKLEDLVIERLLISARILERLDYIGQFSRVMLRGIASQNNIYRIGIFNKDGDRILSIQQQDNSKLPYPHLVIEWIAPLLDGTEKEMIFVLDEDLGETYAVGVHRRKGGAIVLELDAEEMLNFRKTTGIGNLVQVIGENEGIEYIVFQDKGGLILASKNVTEMRKIAGDEFLESALENNWLDTRVYPFDEKEVLEVVSPFQIDDEFYGLFRIGLSMEEVRAVESRGKQRLILITCAMFVIGIISLSFLLVSQNYSLLSKAYDRIQTYTGMVLENIADGIIVSDNRGIISVFNRAAEKIFRREDSEAIGEPVAELYPAINKLLESVSEDQISDRSSEVTVELPEVGNRLLSVRFSRITEAEPEADSVVAIIRDVTEARLMEENMKRTEQLAAMGKLASAVAHEVRNPLSSISMIAQRLGREFAPGEGDEEYRELIGIIRSESARINGIVEDFLHFARPPKLNRQSVKMDQLLDETVSLIKTQAVKQGIKVDIKYSDLGIWVIDREQMKQALLNLLLNGIEAMPNGGNLSIRACVEDKALCLEISDTGEGISEEDMPRIFDLYFTTKETGTGLGLSIVQRIIMEHGGWMDVDSAPGVNTTFRIYLSEGAKVNE